MQARNLCTLLWILFVIGGWDHKAFAQQAIKKSDQLDVMLDIDLAKLREFQPLANLAPDGTHLVDRIFNGELRCLDRITVGMRIPELSDKKQTRILNFSYDSVQSYVIFEAGDLNETLSKLPSFKLEKQETVNGVEIKHYKDGDYRLSVRNKTIELRHLAYAGRKLADCSTPELAKRWRVLRKDSPLRVAFAVPPNTQAKIALPKNGMFNRLSWDLWVELFEGGSLELDLQHDPLLTCSLNAKTDELANRVASEFEELLKFSKQLISTYHLWDSLRDVEQQAAAAWVDGWRMARAGKQFDFEISKPQNFAKLIHSSRVALMEDPAPVQAKPMLDVRLTFDLIPDQKGHAVEISGTTNLPEGTRLKITATPPKLVQTSLIKSGIAEVQTDGSYRLMLKSKLGFKSGEYGIRLTCTGQEQPASVLNRIGSRGAFLSGVHVQSSRAWGNQVSISAQKELRPKLSRREQAAEKRLLRNYKRKSLTGHRVLKELIKDGVAQAPYQVKQNISNNWLKSLAELEREAIEQLQVPESIDICVGIADVLRMAHTKASASPPLQYPLEQWKAQHEKQLAEQHERVLKQIERLQEYIDNL